MNYNQILGVSEQPTPEEVQQAFHEIAFRLHPDTNPGVDPSRLTEALHARNELLEEAERRNTTATPPPQVDNERISTLHKAAHKLAPDAIPRMSVVTPIQRESQPPSPEEIARIQALDDVVAKHPHAPNIILKFVISPTEVGIDHEQIVAHHKKLRTNNDRLEGKY